MSRLRSDGDSKAAEERLPPFPFETNLLRPPTDVVQQAHDTSADNHVDYADEKTKIPRSQPAERPPVPVPGFSFALHHDVQQAVSQELDVSRLNRIHKHLWWAGLAGHARPLHRQRMMRREIVPTEQTDLHLVWFEDRIFIKPLPAFVLDWVFFRDHLCKRRDVHLSACGLLLSYTQLICHPSDLRIALEHGLLPEECAANGLSWARWSAFANAVRANLSAAERQAPAVNERYIYGELRLARLNQIYYVFLGRFLRGYRRFDTNYNSFFGRKLSWLILAIAYGTVIFSALQVALAAEDMQRGGALVHVGYGFSVVTIIAIVGVLGGMAMVFAALFAYNAVMAFRYDVKNGARLTCKFEVNAV